MDSLKNAGISIGDFAEQLLQSGAVDATSVEKTDAMKMAESVSPEPTVPDISKVEVPMDFVNEMTTVGSVGVNMAGKCSDPMKDEKETTYQKPTKEKKPKMEAKEEDGKMLDVISYFRGYRCARKPGPESPKEAGTEYFKKLSNPNRKMKVENAKQESTDERPKRPDWATRTKPLVKANERPFRRRIEREARKENSWKESDPMSNLLLKVEAAVREACGYKKPSSKKAKGMRAIKGKYSA